MQYWYLLAYLVCVEYTTVSDGDVHCISEELIGQLLHFLGPRGREEEVLSLPRQLTDDLSDLM
jgi:hypothetical protein